MRITCPSCASHFELPSELLGKKGRALKCATCQHAWYQAAQVESLDLAAVMGEDYAANKPAAPQAAQAPQRPAQQNMAGGGIQRVPPAPQNAQEGRRVQTAALGAPRSNTRNVQVGQFRQQPGAPAGAPPVPPGAVSMMRRAQPGQAPGQRGQQAPASTAQSWFAGTDRAPQGQPQPPGAAGGPGGPPPQPGAAPGQGAVSWMQNAQQPQGPRTAPLGMAPGAQGGPSAAALPGQSMRGQAGAAGGPGEQAVSWMQNQQGAPQAGASGGPQAPPGQGAVPGAPGQGAAPYAGQQPQGPQTAPLGMAPGAQGGPGAAPLSGQSMRGQAGAAAGPGQGSVSWMQNAQPQQGAQTAPLGMAPGAQGGPGAAPLPGQSMRDAQGPAGPGEAAVSWMKPGAQGAPGAPGQSMRDPGGPTGPGGPAVSQLSNEIVAPGAPGQSMRDPGGPTGPGGPAVSQLSNEIVAPGQGSRSLLDGSEAGPGAPGQSMLGQDGDGAPGQSMMDAGASGGPGASPKAEGASEGASGTDQPGAAGSSGGPGAGPTAAKDEATLVAGESKAAADEDDLDSSMPDADGVAGGPGAAAGDDDELVDPEADRPNFGSSDDEDSDSDADDEDEEDEEAEDGFAAVAARAGARGTRGVKPKARKPMDPAYVSAAMMSGIVASILAVLWFGRGTLAEMMPEFRSVYDRMGVEAPRPGDGLSISESSKRLQRIGGVETLVVRGFVSNVGEVPRAVPALRLELYDARQEVIQDQTVSAPAALLDPGGSAEFEIRLELPQLSAAKGGYAIVWNAD